MKRKASERELAKTKLVLDGIFDELIWCQRDIVANYGVFGSNSRFMRH